MMKLFDSPPSPFCRKVRVLLHESGQTGSVTMVPTTGNPVADEAPFTENPLGKIPCLARDDGGPMFDSRVICRYLDTRFDAGLYPQDRIWDVLTLEALADGLMDAAILVVYESRWRPEQERSATWVDGQWFKVTRALDALNDGWMPHLGGAVDMGQIAVACALGYLDFRHDDRAWRTGRKALAGWYETFSARASMQATRPDA